MTSAAPPARPGLIARFLATGQRPGDDEDLRVRKRTAVVTAVALAIASLAYAPIGLAMNAPAITVIAFGQVIGDVLAIGWLARTGRLTLAVVSMIALGQLVILSGVLMLGGFTGSNGNLVWGLLTPMAAVLFLGRRGALPALASFALVVLIGLFVRAQLSPEPLVIPDSVSGPLWVLNLLGPAAVGLGMVVLIDGERLQARARAESLLLNVLPRSIVHRLDAGERVIADHCPDVTVLFSDVVGFTPFAEAEPPQRVVQVLDGLFSAFDDLVEARGLEKIKTIGDAYMAVAGVPVERPDHAEVMVELAIAMHAAADAQPIDGRRLQLRTGIATGPVVAGIIGRRKFSYDLWGDTVNTAARMESTSVPGCIQVTPETRDRCQAAYPWEVRERVEVKGKGPMRTFLLDPSRVTDSPAASA